MLTGETIDRLLTDESIYGIERVIWELIRDRLEVLQRIDGLSPTDRVKLDSIETGATHNKTDGELQDITRSSGMLPWSRVAGLATVAMSGKYSDLAGAPAGFSGSYNDLTNKPQLFSGDYTDLQGKPVLFTGEYSKLTGKPILATVASTGDYNDLLNLPVLFSGNYTDLSGLPVLFNGDYNSLTSKPTLAIVASTGSYNDLLNKPTLFNGTYAALTGKPALFSGDYNALTNRPLLFSGSYLDLSDKPALFSGSYLDLTNKPTIPAPTTSASALITGTLDNARLDATVTKLGNSVNTASGLVQLTSTNKLPALDGSLLTNLPVQLPAVDSNTLTGTGAIGSPISVKLTSTQLIAAIRGSVSATGTGLTYDNTTGVFTYTPPASSASTKIQTGNYTLLKTDDVVLIDNATTNLTITLPDALTCLNQDFVIKRISGGLNTCTILPVLSQLIDSTTSIVLSALGKSVRLRAYKTTANLGAWVITGSY